MPSRRPMPTATPFPTDRLPRLLLLGGLLGLAAPAGAATLTVTSTANTTGGPDCTLRDAITAANTDTATGGCLAGSGADEIVFAPALTAGGDAAITLSTVGNSLAGPAAFGITSAVTIRGPQGANGITLDASGATMRHFNVAASGSLTLEYLTLTGGRAQGGPGGRGGGALPSGGGGAAGLGGVIFTQLPPPKRRWVGLAGD